MLYILAAIDKHEQYSDEHENDEPLERMTVVRHPNKI